MSYDLEIRSDERYSQARAFQTLDAFIASLPDIYEESPGFLRYEDAAQQMHMEIDLELVDDEGELAVDIDPEGENKVNRISLHIPAANMHHDARHQRYLEIANMIANYLGWQLIDLQQDG